MTCYFLALFSLGTLAHHERGDDLVAATRQQVEALSTLSGRVRRTIRNQGVANVHEGYFVTRVGYFQAYAQNAALVSHIRIEKNAAEQFGGAPDKLSGSRGPLERFGVLTNQADALRLSELRLFGPKQKLVWLWQLLDGSEGPVQIVRDKDSEGAEIAKVRFNSAGMKFELDLAAKWNYMPVRVDWTGEVVFPEHKVKQAGTTTLADFVEVRPGVYFPTRIATSMSENGNETLTIETTILNLSADEAEGRKYPPFAFPRGIPITDFNDKTYYKLDPNGSKEPITSKNGKPIAMIFDPLEKDEMQSPAQAKIAAQAALGPTAAAEPSRIPWIWIAVGAAFILMAGAVYRRYRTAT